MSKLSDSTAVAVEAPSKWEERKSWVKHFLWNTLGPRTTEEGFAAERKEIIALLEEYSTTEKSFAWFPTRAWLRFLLFVNRFPTAFRGLENVFFFIPFGAMFGKMSCVSIQAQDGRMTYPGSFEWILPLLGQFLLLFVLPLQRRLPVGFPFTAHHIGVFLLTFLVVEFYYYVYHRMAHGIEFLWFGIHDVHHAKDVTQEPFQCEWTEHTSFIEGSLPIVMFSLYAYFVHPGILWVYAPLDYTWAFYEHSSTQRDFRTQEMFFIHTQEHHLIHHNATLDMSYNYGFRLKLYDLIFGTHRDHL
jgi:sterol desaturase/sphingolipid hydroxylase (fatty acid hydroxylase superfamily)